MPYVVTQQLGTDDVDENCLEGGTFMDANVNVAAIEQVEEYLPLAIFPWYSRVAATMFRRGPWCWCERMLEVPDAGMSGIWRRQRDAERHATASTR